MQRESVIKNSVLGMANKRIPHALDTECNQNRERNFQCNFVGTPRGSLASLPAPPSLFSLLTLRAAVDAFRDVVSVNGPTTTTTKKRIK
jgi:hypothetical protein